MSEPREKKAKLSDEYELTAEEIEALRKEWLQDIPEGMVQFL